MGENPGIWKLWTDYEHYELPEPLMDGDIEAGSPPPQESAPAAGAPAAASPPNKAGKKGTAGKADAPAAPSPAGKVAKPTGKATKKSS